MPAFAELILFAAVAAAAVAIGKSARKNSRPNGESGKRTRRCPGCGSPAVVRGSSWECPYCGDSGRK